MHLLYWANANLARKQIIERLGDMPDVKLTVAETLDEVLPLLGEADALALCDPSPEQARTLVDALNAPGCAVRWMHIITAGRESLEKAGLPARLDITYAAGAVAPGVAEHAMALMLALCRRVPTALSAASRRKWDRSMAARASALEGGTLLIVGYGQIGKNLARRAKAFDMTVLTVSRSQQRDEYVDEALPMDALHEALARADFIVLGIASTQETRHLMGLAEFARCKPSAYLVNVARGEVVDQVALAAALAAGQIAGAGLDVTTPEPLPEDDPLWLAPNLLLTPHYAGAGNPRNFMRVAEGLAENAALFAAGKELKHRV